MKRSDELDNVQHEYYYDWRIKNGKGDTSGYRKAFLAGWEAADREWHRSRPPVPPFQSNSPFRKE